MNDQGHLPIVQGHIPLNHGCNLVPVRKVHSPGLVHREHRYRELHNPYPVEQRQLRNERRQEYHRAPMMLNYHQENSVDRYQPRRNTTDYTTSENEQLIDDVRSQDTSNVYDGSESEVSGQAVGLPRRPRYSRSSSSDQSLNYNNNSNSHNSCNSHFSDNNVNDYRLNNNRLNNFHNCLHVRNNNRPCSSHFSNTETRQNINNNDPLSRIATVFEATLKSVKESSGNNVNLINRLMSNKSLPTFTGKPLDWLRFKRSYELLVQSEFDYRVNVNRFRARLNIVCITEKLLVNLICDGWPEVNCNFKLKIINFLIILFLKKR